MYPTPLPPIAKDGYVRFPPWMPMYPCWATSAPSVASDAVSPSPPLELSVHVGRSAKYAMPAFVSSFTCARLLANSYDEPPVPCSPVPNVVHNTPSWKNDDSTRVSLESSG